MLNILHSLRKWTASALSLGRPMPLPSPASDTVSLPCLSGGTSPSNLSARLRSEWPLPRRFWDAADDLGLTKGAA